MTEIGLAKMRRAGQIARQIDRVDEALEALRANGELQCWLLVADFRNAQSFDQVSRVETHVQLDNSVGIRHLEQRRAEIVAAAAKEDIFVVS